MLSLARVMRLSGILALASVLGGRPSKRRRQIKHGLTTREWENRCSRRRMARASRRRNRGR